MRSPSELTSSHGSTQVVAWRCYPPGVLNRLIAPPIGPALLAIFLIAGLLVISFGFYTITSLQSELHSISAESAKTRVTTVEQRCALTKLDLGESLRNRSPKAPAYRKSLAGCRAQLVKVKGIAAKAAH